MSNFSTLYTETTASSATLT